MRRALLLVILMAVTIVGTSGVAAAIINGQPDGNSHPYVGMVYNNKAFCSGSLISSTVFLTAGHCTELFKQPGGSQVYVTFESQFDFNRANDYTGTPYTHPEYNGVFPDVGVVVLDQAVTPNPGTAELPDAGLAETLDTGQPLTAVGYGVRDFAVGGGPPRPTGIATRYNATVKFINIYNPLQMFIKVRGGSAGEGGEGACFGDSGGPLFLPDQRTVVAITHGGTNSRCAGVNYAQRVDLPVVLSWLNSFL